MLGYIVLGKSDICCDLFLWRSVCYLGSHYTLNIDYGDGSEVETIYNNGTAETHTVKHTFHLPGDLSVVVTASNDVPDPAIQYTANIDVQVTFYNFFKIIQIGPLLKNL